MSDTILPARLLPVLTLLDRTALGAVLLSPLLLLHAHGIAEGAIALADACFLARCVLTRDWVWTRAAWWRIGVAWWIWMAVCSLPFSALGLGEGKASSLLQALVFGRFLIFVAPWSTRSCGGRMRGAGWVG